MSKRNVFKLVCLILIGLGLAISSYLLIGHFQMMAGKPAAGIDVCRAVFGADCNATLQSPLAVQLGLPLAGWGLVFYATLVSLLLMGWVIGKSFELEASIAAILLTLAAAVAGVALTFTMLTGKAPLCPLCLTIHVINVLLVWVLKGTTGRTIAALWRSLVAGGRYVLGGTTDEPETEKWKITGLLMSLLIAVVVYQWVLIQTDRRILASDAPPDPAKVIAAYESKPTKEIPVNGNDPRIGPEAAPAQLVVFSSFQCPACRHFAHDLSHLVEDYEGKLSVVFKHFPLGKECNPLLEVDMQPQACAAARAAQAAHQQGAFWRFHDALFIGQIDGSDDAMAQIAEQLELDVEQFRTDLTADATAAKVSSDIKLATKLSVNGTPTVYLNGKETGTFALSELEILIRHEAEPHEH